MLGTALRGILHQPTTRKAELAELNNINWSTIVRDTRDSLISIRWETNQCSRNARGG